MKDEKKNLTEIVRRVLVRKLAIADRPDEIDRLNQNIDSVVDALNQTPEPTIGTLQGRPQLTDDWIDLCSIPTLEAAYKVIERLEASSGKGFYQVVDRQGNVIAPKPD